MRIRSLPLLGVLASLVASLAVAAPVHPKAAPAATSCGCRHARAAGPARYHVHRHARRHAHVRVSGRAGGWSEHHADMGGPMWRDEHRWREEGDWGAGPGWSEDEARWAFGHAGHWGYRGYWDHARAERPWATDRSGFLTWPGKTRFIGGRPVDDEGPPLPPPPEGWQGPPPPPDADEGYEIRRF